ncbi:MAG: hypothetical protein OXG82_00290 [Gammaproteobacteria bacterium]|nr:hypothetical protein [Gammaproteobacteria bacterium]
MRTLAVAAVLAAGAPVFAAGDDENTRDVYVSSHGAWTARATVDTFEEREVAWYAFHRQGDDGGFALTCRVGDVLSFDAYADNMFINSIGLAWQQRQPIVVRVKVDDYPVVEVKGKYPNTIASREADVRKLIAELTDGEVARIRTQHGEEQHTFVLSLDGFREAAAWTLGKCGYVLKDRKDEEEE